MIDYLVGASQVSCEYIATANPVERATLAEALQQAHNHVTKCRKCEKYHVWVEASSEEWTMGMARRYAAIKDNFEQVGPNAYLHVGYRKKKSTKKDRQSNSSSSTSED